MDDEIGDRLIERFGDVVTNVEFSIAVTNDAEKQRLAELTRQIKSHDGANVQNLITGA